MQCFCPFCEPGRSVLFPPQIKRLKDLEKEKDALCSGLEILERTRLWYLQRLEENRARQDATEAQSGVGCSQEGALEVQDRASLVFTAKSIHNSVYVALNISALLL